MFWQITSFPRCEYHVFLSHCSMDLLQRNLAFPGGQLLNYEFPLFFLDRSDVEFQRTVWGALQDRGSFHHPSDGDPVTWAADQIVKFLHREQKLSIDLLKEIVPGKPVHAELNRRSDSGLIERVIQFDPSPVA